MPDRKAEMPGVAAGIISGCPFCLARTTSLPGVGDRIRVLTDFRAGLVGIVVETPPNLPLRRGEFLVQFDHDPPNTQQIVSLERDLIVYSLEVPVPIWAPPISLCEAAELDKVLIKFCKKSLSQNHWKPYLPAFYEIIRHIWYNRLPIEGTEMWALLEAHGVAERWKRRLTQLYEDGRGLLVYAIGRRPIKKKRVLPFSL
jgi:hypothetical protein